MHELSHIKEKIIGGFIHIPFIPEQKHKPNMKLSTIVEGIKLAVQVALEEIKK